DKLGLIDKNAKAFSRIKLKKDFASLSLNAINKILHYVKEGLLYSHAVFMANVENIVDEKIWSDAVQRKYIQDKIALIIENHTYENSLLEVVNSLIKDCKSENCYYSKEAESTYKADLNKKLTVFFKNNLIEDKGVVLDELFTIFIEQLKAYEFIK